MTHENLTMEDSKVQIHGTTAKYYDVIMNIGSLGIYAWFIRDVIKRMEIQSEDAILDLGCGTGRNSCLMAKYLSAEGRIVGVDIEPLMIQQFNQRCRNYPNVSVQNARIDETLPFENEFDKAFMSFVFHGFTDELRQKIAGNIHRALKPGSEFVLLDFNEFNLDAKPFWFRYAFKAIECPLAFEFIEMDWKTKLHDWGFETYYEHTYLMDTIRLLKARRI